MCWLDKIARVLFRGRATRDIPHFSTAFMAKFIPRLVNSRVVSAHKERGRLPVFVSPLARLLFTMSPTWRACSHAKFNLVPRALFPGFGGGPKAREKRPGDEVDAKLFPIYPSISSLSSSCGLSQLQCTGRAWLLQFKISPK